MLQLIAKAGVIARTVWRVAARPWRAAHPKLRKAVIAALAMWYVLPAAFVMASHAGNVLQQAESDGYDIPFLFESSLYANAIVGVFSDVAYNASYGWIRFRENPVNIITDGEFMFTSRVNRLVADDGWRGEKAREWCELLDRVDPGHCSDYQSIR